MKIALFGASGRLGKEFLKLDVGAKHELHAFTHNDAEIADFKRLETVIRELGADIIINAAAYNDVDSAEDEFEKAFNVNGLGPHNLAVVAKKIGSTLIHFSTDFVFDGNKGKPYCEDDVPNPISTYGKSKLMGEIAVRLTQSSSYIIRTSCLYGRFGDNFLTRLVEYAKRDGYVSVPNDLVGSPTYARHLAEATFKLIDKAPPFGIYHIVNNGYCSRYEWALEFLKRVRPETEVKPVSISNIKLKAKRPPFSALSTAKIEALDIHLVPWTKALGDYIRERDSTHA